MPPAEASPSLSKCETTCCYTAERVATQVVCCQHSAAHSTTCCNAPYTTPQRSAARWTQASQSFPKRARRLSAEELLEEVRHCPPLYESTSGHRGDNMCVCMCACERERVCVCENVYIHAYQQCYGRRTAQNSTRSAPPLAKRAVRVPLVMKCPPACPRALLNGHVPSATQQRVQRRWRTHSTRVCTGPPEPEVVPSSSGVARGSRRPQAIGPTARIGGCRRRCRRRGADRRQAQNHTAQPDWCRRQRTRRARAGRAAGVGSFLSESHATLMFSSSFSIPARPPPRAWAAPTPPGPERLIRSPQAGPAGTAAICPGSKFR
jgi:hypothetical protein